MDSWPPCLLADAGLLSTATMNLTTTMDTDAVALGISAMLAAISILCVLRAAAEEHRLSSGRATETEIRRAIRKGRRIWGRKEQL